MTSLGIGTELVSRNISTKMPGYPNAFTVEVTPLTIETTSPIRGSLVAGLPWITTSSKISRTK